ncbi:MAG TPA: hypothetical protein VGM38_09220 [Pseudolysinimonas sp.]
MASDAHDLDDTVARPSRGRSPVRRLAEDLDDTITVQRLTSGAEPPALVEPPAAIVPDVSHNVWSQPLPAQPPPFRIRLADGTLVPLDQPVYLGRKPSVPRIHPGGIPLLVTLDSPQREVSSTHLELRTVGGTIVATDAKSTNGSVLRMPGVEPRTLIGGESVVVIPGTVIELGDGNLIELLAPDPDAASPDSSGKRS